MGLPRNTSMTTSRVSTKWLLNEDAVMKPAINNDCDDDDDDDDDYDADDDGNGDGDGDNDDDDDYTYV
ncbi:hypothetical protein HZH68_009746 [Vespula germanica]|uniref:Uncharacterized protein n=1 Tax=Vespula germanica TaxID=30212 RepID=A0A834JY01_VESGE|nr:hypothetical protein HZH68_009746 [Vespula germanica]